MMRSLLFATCVLLVIPAVQAQTLESHLAVYDLATGQTRTVFSAEAHFEAPNWSHDGQSLIFNWEGRLYRVPVEGGAPVVLPTGALTDLNNDHGLSLDGTTLVISSQDGHIYTVPAEGGTPVRVTEKTPSWWHGISPDGQTLAYVGRREGRFDLYVIPIDGGEETPLTSDEAHDDGPDYSPDGQWIYWNTDRGGTFNIWRLPAEGGEAEQITDDAYEDWFPHPSPDGEKVVFLSFEPGTEGHPPNRNVHLRMMTPDGEDLQTLVEIFGGQGTINVPSWSPDSGAFAFVYYRLLEDR